MKYEEIEKILSKLPLSVAFGICLALLMLVER